MIFVLLFSVNLGFGLDAGFGKADITPSLESIRLGKVSLAGYDPLRKAIGVKDPIVVRAMALWAEDGLFMHLAYDLTGLSNRMISTIRDDLARFSGAHVDRILISATHSHSTPDLQGPWGGTESVYRDFIVSQSKLAVRKALQARAPVRAHFVQTTATNHNRRNWEFTDPVFSIVDFRKVSDGARVGTFFNFGAHPVLENRDSQLISRDYPGKFLDLWEKSYGGVGIFINGSLGDLNPPRMGVPPENDHVSAFAAHLVERARAGLAEAVLVDFPTVRVRWREAQEVVTNKMYLVAQNLGRLDYDLIRIDDRIGVKFQVAIVDYGLTLQAVACPGEPVTRSGFALKEALTSGRKMVFGLTGNTLGYLVPLDEWKMGRHDHYEENFSINRMMGEHVLSLARAILSSP